MFDQMLSHLSPIFPKITVLNFSLTFVGWGSGGVGLLEKFIKNTLLDYLDK